MHWAIRIIGVLTVLGFVAWSADLADRTLVGEPSVAVRASADPDQSPVVKALESVAIEPPEYLAYRPGVSPGLYMVSDLPGSDDRDNELGTENARSNRRSNDRLSRTSRNEERGRLVSDDDERPGDEDGFVLYDIVPGHSAAPGPARVAQGDLAPGLYATPFGATDCGYELRRVMEDGVERMIGQDFLQDGRMLVEINETEPDSFDSLPGCGEWIEWSPATKPLTRADNGDYWKEDLARGVWKVPEGCFWEKVVAHRGAELFDVTDSGRGPGSMVVGGNVRGVRIRGCRQPLVHGAFTS